MKRFLGLFVLFLLLATAGCSWTGQGLSRLGSSMTGEQGLVALQGRIQQACSLENDVLRPGVIFAENGTIYQLRPVPDYLGECLDATPGADYKFNGSVDLNNLFDSTEFLACLEANEPSRPGHSSAEHKATAIHCLETSTPKIQLKTTYLRKK